MSVITVGGLEFEPYIPRGDYQEDCAGSRGQDPPGLQRPQMYSDTSISEDIVFVGILNGAALFLADIVREVGLECELDFMKVSSYQGVESTGGDQTEYSPGSRATKASTSSSSKTCWTRGSPSKAD